MKPITQYERAMHLRAMYDKALAQHEILSQHIIDAGRAVFTIGRRDSGMYFAEIGALSYGTVFVNGDVDAVVFGHCSDKTWEGKLSWLRGTNFGYAEEKASIGSTCSEMAREVDEDVALSDLLYWRRSRQLEREDARVVYDLIRNGEVHEARNELYARTEDFELTIGTCTAPRVILAQACITKLCDLLDAQEARAQGSAPAEHAP